MSYTTLFDVKLRAEGRYNLRGGLGKLIFQVDSRSDNRSRTNETERIAGVAATIGKITNKSTTAILQDITQLPEFKAALSSALCRARCLGRHESQMPRPKRFYSSFCPLLGIRY
jgi:hypothetical protein